MATRLGIAAVLLLSLAGLIFLLLVIAQFIATPLMPHFVTGIPWGPAS